jgi:aspartate/methionine/tyrosine aminotransferase
MGAVVNSRICRDRVAPKAVFSARTTFDLSDNPLAAQVRRRRAGGRSICDLSVSNPTTAELAYDTDAIATALAAAAREPYEPRALGRGASREVLSQQWGRRGRRVPAEHIALTASTSEAYAALFKLFCDPGQAVLVPEPSYPLLAELARFESIELRPFRLAYDGAWHVDFDSLEAALTKRTRAVVVVSPNNPTGSFIKRAEFGRLASYGLPLISDEVFAAYGLRQPFATSVLDTQTDGLVVALEGLSKLAGLPQLKLAWMSFGGSPSLVRQAVDRLEFILDATLSVNGPTERALPALLEVGRATSAAIVQRLERNLATLDRALNRTALGRLYLEGGWYAVVRLPDVRSEADWVEGLLEEEGVLVQPGWLYDFVSMPVCVLSLLTPPGQFSDGVARLVRYVETVV